MRYKTCGDWQFIGTDEKTLIVTVLKQTDWRYEALLAVHEIYEALACKANGVTEEIVDAYDFAHQRVIENKGEFPPGEKLTQAEWQLLQAYRQENGLALEPGECPGCPYQVEHEHAEEMEAALAKSMGVDWGTYLVALEKSMKE
jgi:hypothetical protein